MKRNLSFFSSFAYSISSHSRLYFSPLKLAILLSPFFVASAHHVLSCCISRSSSLITVSIDIRISHWHFVSSSTPINLPSSFDFNAKLSPHLFLFFVVPRIGTSSYAQANFISQICGIFLSLSVTLSPPVSRTCVWQSPEWSSKILDIQSLFSLCLVLSRAEWNGDDWSKRHVNIVLCLLSFTFRFLVILGVRSLLLLGLL